MIKGYFISFEGGEGSGKSTQLRRLGDALENRGIDIIQTREPGGNSGAEEIRRLLVSGTSQRWRPKAELLLHYSARIEHVESVIKPALKEGKWVICDRFHDSTKAYQGYGHELGIDIVNTLHQLLLDDFQPDFTIIFDLPVELGLRRAMGREGAENRYEKMSHAFHERIRIGFLEIARREFSRCVLLDASKNQDEVYRKMIDCINTRFKLTLI